MNRSFVACCAAVVLLSGCLLLGCSGSAPQPEVSGNEASQTSAAEISFEPEADKIHVLINGKPFTTYHFEEKWDKPFLHPVRTLSGVDISRGWPVEPREGESDDHIWHRGLFMGHDRINGADFWREQGRDKTAILVPRSTPTFSVADGAGTITADLDLLTTKKESLGAIRQEFTFSVVGDSAVIDAHITVLADRGVALTMGDTEEGWVGFRFDDAFKQENGATLLNSDGLLGTENIWGNRADWVDYSTMLHDEMVGLAIFDHPSNPGYPTYWHARGYGLCTANPFGVRNFTGDESKDGTMVVPEGGELEFQYRLVVHPGSADEAKITDLYARFKNGS